MRTLIPATAKMEKTPPKIAKRTKKRTTPLPQAQIIEKTMMTPTTVMKETALEETAQKASKENSQAATEMKVENVPQERAQPSPVKVDGADEVARMKQRHQQRSLRNPRR